MTNETALLALLESKETEANAKAEWIADWSEENLPLLLAGQLETDAATLLAEVNAERATQINQAIYLLMISGDKVPLTLQIQQVLYAGLHSLAQDAWSNHLAALHDAMSDEQWEHYQQRSAA
ncbi:hypothetical protein [Aeromonas dhakensis]|uniref:hypothetical protein n=1 Tax=Aeromonas dhakensis TaxID=196024 RepID=UPI001B3A310B|nr:hypothetical protein [Aeromonas dhakensis]MBQ4672915.1 hypothetical protein [Aeromonas dhakensis]